MTYFSMYSETRDIENSNLKKIILNIFVNNSEVSKLELVNFIKNIHNSVDTLKKVMSFNNTIDHIQLTENVLVSVTYSQFIFLTKGSDNSTCYTHVTRSENIDSQFYFFLDNILSSV